MKNESFIKELGDGSVGQEWLLHKHKDLSLNPQNPSKKWPYAGATGVALE